MGIGVSLVSICAGVEANYVANSQVRWLSEVVQ
jgi:hypothetical protein